MSRRLKIQGQAGSFSFPRCACKYGSVSFSPCLHLSCSKAGDSIVTEEPATVIQGSRAITCPSLAAARSTCIRQAPCQDDEPAPVGSPGEEVTCLWQLMDDVILVCEFLFWSTQKPCLISEDPFLPIVQNISSFLCK